MTRSISQSVADIEAFAENFGLTKLTHDHLDRMRELAPIAAELGGKLPRPQAQVRCAGALLQGDVDQLGQVEM